MKKLILLLALFFTGYAAHAQTTGKLLGLRYDDVGTQWIVDSISFPGHNLRDLDTITTFSYLQTGESTFDPMNHRYFHYTEKGVIVIDANTGALLDTLADTLLLLGLEYDPVSEKLYALEGSYGGGLQFMSIDPDSGTATVLDTLQGISSVALGQTTFDMCSRLYFFISNDTTVIGVNAGDGTIRDSMHFDQNQLIGMEAGNMAPTLFGLGFRDTMIDFVKYNFLTKTRTVLSSFPVISFYPGEATLDREKGFYVVNAVDYIYILDTATGAVVDTVSNASQLMGLEAIYTEYCLVIDGIQEAKHVSLEATVFPNPTSEKAALRFNEPVKDAGIELIDFSGRRVSYTAHFSGSIYSADLSGLPAGIYLLKVINAGSQAAFKVIKK